MRVVYLLRKPTTEPTVATNALRWGAGALNIDAGRIAAPLETILSHSKSPDAAKGNGIFGRYGGKTTHQTEGQRLGRWPANLILQHRPACVREGTKKVKSSNATGGQGFRSSYVGGSHNGQSHPGLTYADPDGTETVPAWRCDPECPVAALDVQSGVTSSRASDADYTLSVNNNPTRVARNIKSGVHFSDTGGASRFFRQVHPGAPQVHPGAP